MRYLPVVDEDSSLGEEGGFHSDATPCACLSAEGVGEPVHYQPAEWRPAVQQAWWYRLSSFSYCVVGLLTALRPQPLVTCAPFFPFRAMGIGIFINGLLSYMGDVATWGYWSRWKAADIFLATTNTVLQGVIVVMALLGFAQFPPLSPAVLGVSLVVALVCKQRGGAAVARLDCYSFLRWHTAWHLTLPLGAAIASQLLIEPPRLLAGWLSTSPAESRVG